MSIESSLVAEVDPLKPYLRALEVAVVLLLCAAAWFAVHHYGSTRYDEGVGVEKKLWDADRAQWQAALDKQKADASGLLVAAYAQRDALARSNQLIHDQQEKDYANHRAETTALHAQLSTRSLRYVAVAAPGAGCGKGSGAAMSGAASQAQSPAGTIVQLPAEISGRLYDLAYSADQLRDAYARCVAAVNGAPAL